ncbi:MAG: GAF domain-containing protein [Anaerolineae bacterium]|nr:GAF domain-containing protein [Anaerolineae bacterium]
MASRKLLVVTGNYGVVQQVKEGLGGKPFTIHAAFSHLDALYQVGYEKFDLVLVDGAMIHRKTGERTSAALARVEDHPPLLVYIPQNGKTPAAARGNIVISSLEEAALYPAVARLLRLPGHDAPEQASGKRQGIDSLPNTSIFWRDEEMQTLFALGRSLTEVLDLSEVLNRVVEAARHLTDAEQGMILLPDGQTGQLYLRAKVGIDLDVANNFRVKTQDTIAGSVFESGRPVLVGESGPQKVKTEYFVNSLLYVPILHQGQPIGVLGVTNQQKHDVFNERHLDLLVNLATYTAIAIENARIHGQTIRRTRELQALIDASQAINASLSFDNTLRAISEQLIRVLNVGHAEIYAWDADAYQLRLLARYQRACWREVLAPIIKLAQRPLARVAIESRRHVFVQRGRRDHAEQERFDQIGACASLVLPILSGDRLLGVAQAYYLDNPAAPPSADVAARGQRLALEALASIGTEEDFSHGFKSLDEAKTAVKADWIEVLGLDVDGTSLKPRLAVGTGVWADEIHPVVDAADYADVLDMLALQQPLNHYLSEDNLGDGARAFLRATASRSLLALPLVGHGQTIGLVLFADTLHARAFTAREIDLGRALVGQAAMALENVGLVHNLEQSLRDLQEAQNQLIQGARLSAMGELAAAVAHQINNPLTTIVLDTELLLETEQLDPKQREVLAAVSRSGKRAAGVVHRLLAMARPISSDAPREPIDVLYTISDIDALVRPHLEREGIKLTIQTPEAPLPPVMAVAGELNDVWLNLILNAHDAVVGRKSPEISVSAVYDPEDAVNEIAVWDNGPGIRADIVGEIFKPFFTTKPVGEGTGLGLHICRQVVERVGGSISVHTATSGARFVVRLPIMRSS